MTREEPDTGWPLLVGTGPQGQYLVGYRGQGGALSRRGSGGAEPLREPL